MAELLTNTEQQITPETLPLLRKELATVRETKGQDKKALEMARWLRGGAEKLEAHEDVVDLYWEEYLIGKHIAMDARDKEGLWSLPTKVKGIAEGYLLMRKSAKKAQEYIDKHDVEKKRPRSGRFLGEISMFERRYGEARDHFSHSIDLFEKNDNWRDRVNALELKGFLAEATILDSDPEMGIGLARRTFLEYDKGDGAKLRENDYYTWAVWKSGCTIKAWHALLARDIPINEDLVEGMMDMLQDAEDILIIPEDEETWGDRNFEIRKQEIESIKRAHNERE